MTKIVLIDDKKIFLERFVETWQDQFSNFEILTYNHPLSFFKDCNQQMFEHDIRAIIIDKIGPGYDAERNKFADEFRKHFPNFEGHLVLCSSCFHKNQPEKLTVPGFDRVCTKREVIDVLKDLLG